MAAAGVLSAQALLAACGGTAATNTPIPSSAPASTAPASAASAATSTAPGAASPTRPASPVAVATPRLNTNAKLTFYNAQHENLVKGMAEGFTKETGVQVEIRSGKDFDLANQIVQEGASSPADAFITENSPAMQVVADKGLFAPIDKDILGQVPARFVPSSGDWMGVAGRSTVFVYNPSSLPAASLPQSIMDLAGPDWKDKVGIAPSGADFQAIVSAVVAIKGADAALTWLKGLKANARIYTGNGAILRAANAGEVPGGIIYHYYWYQDRADTGANSKNTELHFFGNKDAGGFFSVSGIGALKSSKHPVEAQALLRYMTGKAGQQILASGTFSLEYTLNPEVPVNPKLKPFNELSIPDVDIAKLNGPQVIELMQQAGLL
jgi:iron(III) transport system substrate-binding protein